MVVSLTSLLLSSLTLILVLAGELPPTQTVQQALQLYSQGNRREARRMLEGIARSEPANFEAHFRLGLMALDAGDVATSVMSLQTALRLRPASAPVWLALAESYSKSGKKDLAQAAASKAEALGSQDPFILHGLAMFHSGNGAWVRAAEFEGRYASLSTGDRAALPRAVQYYLQADQPKPAIDLVKTGLAREKRADLRNLLGKAYEADGQHPQAILELQEAIRMKPDEESYVFDLGYVLLLHHNFDVAIQLLEVAKKSFPSSGQLELALGIAYYGQRRFGEAVDSFLRTAELAPQVEQPYVFLGRILQHAESRLPEVTAKFAAFSKSHPDNYLGYFLHAKGLLAQIPPSGPSPLIKEAEGLLLKSISLNPGSWESHFELGSLLERKREFEGAAQHLERSIQLDSKNPTAHYRLARVYDRLGKTEQAEAERSLHEKLIGEERGVVEKYAAGLKRLELVVK